MERQGTARGVEVCGRAREMEGPGEVQQLTEPDVAEVAWSKPRAEGSEGLED